MEDLVFRVALVSQESGQFSGVPMDHCDVEGSEVLVEGEVSQVVVDVKEKCILVVLWWLGACDPVEFVYTLSEFRS